MNLAGTLSCRLLPIPLVPIIVSFCLQAPSRIKNICAGHAVESDRRSTEATKSIVQYCKTHTPHHNQEYTPSRCETKTTPQSPFPPVTST